MSDDFFKRMQNEIFSNIVSGQDLTETLKYSNLLLACESGFTDWVVELLKYESTKELINKQEGEKSPLLLACEGGHVDICELLIANGADVNIIVGQYRRTPLIVATNNDDINIINLLLDNGADPNIEYLDGKTALFFCKSENVLHQLLNYGADFNHLDRMRGTPLHYFYSRFRTETIANLGKILLGYGADPNYIYYVDGTIINKLINANSWNNAIVLLRAGADLNICDITITRKCPTEIIIDKCVEMIKILSPDTYEELFMIRSTKYFLMKIVTMIDDPIIKRRMNQYIGDNMMFIEFLHNIPQPILEEIYDAVQQYFP